VKVLEVIGGLIVVVAIGAVVVLGVPAALKWGQDVTRESQQHSRSYVESKTQLLNGLMTDYEDADATPGQKTAIANEFCYQVTLLVPEERPANIVRFQTAHC